MTPGGKLAEVADVVRRAYRFDGKAGVTRYIEGLAGAVGHGLAFTLERHAAFAVDDFHDFRGAGIEDQGGGQDDANGLFRAIGENDRVRYALAVEIDIGFFDDADLVKLCVHGVCKIA